MTPLDSIPDRDGPRDECGVFGVYAPESDVARLAYFALYALQHRGQESTGIATSEGGHIMTVRDLGLVSQVFDEDKLQALQGEVALGRLGDRYCVASESCAFDIIGGELLREVQPGELVSLGERGIETRQVVESKRKAFCVFEHIYFARPDSVLEGNRTQVSRRKMGEILWREAPVDADVVIAVPDSGNAAAAGYSRASGISRDDGLIKNRYVARTFIQPG